MSGTTETDREKAKKLLVKRIKSKGKSIFGYNVHPGDEEEGHLREAND